MSLITAEEIASSGLAKAISETEARLLAEGIGGVEWIVAMVDTMLTYAESLERPSRVGLKAVWNGTDATWAGEIRADFTKRNGKPMVTIEDDKGNVHHYPADSDKLKVEKPA